MLLVIIRTTPQVVPDSAQIPQPSLENRHVPFALGPEGDIAIKQADDLVQEKRLCSGELVPGGADLGHDEEEVGNVVLKGAENHGFVGGGAVDVQDRGAEAGDDARRRVVLVQMAMHEGCCVVGSQVCWEQLDAVDEVVNCSVGVVELPRLVTVLSSEGLSSLTVVKGGWDGSNRSPRKGTIPEGMIGDVDDANLLSLHRHEDERGWVDVQQENTSCRMNAECPRQPVYRGARQRPRLLAPHQL